MPGFDGTGPTGSGPNGRGFGPCGGVPKGSFRNWGMRRGWRRFGWFGGAAPFIEADEEKFLEQQKSWIESRLESLRNSKS